jgi:hypothetical protein
VADLKRWAKDMNAATTSFSDQMIRPLDELAGQVLRLKQYGRLHLVAELLAVFSSGAWDRLEEEEKKVFLGKLRSDFHVRAWDDWEFSADSALSRISALIAAESKGIERKQ